MSKLTTPKRWSSVKPRKLAQDLALEPKNLVVSQRNFWMAQCPHPYFIFYFLDKFQGSNRCLRDDVLCLIENFTYEYFLLFYWR